MHISKPYKISPGLNSKLIKPNIEIVVLGFLNMGAEEYLDESSLLGVKDLGLGYMKG